MTIPLEGRKIALIGGAGFIGHNLALELLHRGADVHVIDSLQVNNLLAFSAKMPDLHHRNLYLRILHQRLDMLREAGVPVHLLDAREYIALGELLNDQIHPEVIVHLAAVAHAGRANNGKDSPCHQAPVPDRARTMPGQDITEAMPGQ